MDRALLDTSFLVAYLCERDVHHARAKDLFGRLRGEVVPVMTDVVFGETVTVLARRSKEWAFSFEAVVRDLMGLAERMARFAVYMLQEFDQVVDLVVESKGELSFNDALLVVGARQEGIGGIITFDEDFKPYLKVIDGSPSPSRR